MTKATAELLVQMGSEGRSEPEIYLEYSGRGMYGSKTMGVVCSSTEQLLADVLNYLIKTDKEEDQSQLFLDLQEITTEVIGFRKDNLGKRIIIY